MEVSAQQRRYARAAGVLLIVHLVLEMGGDYPTILARGGETFAETSRYVVDNQLLWRAALVSVGLGWISVAVLGFAFYVVLGPVNKRVAQLALILRLGGAFVGAACLMLRVVKLGVQSATISPTFTHDQLRALASFTQQGINAGVYTAWIFIGLSSTLFFLLFGRSGYLPRLLAWFGVLASLVLVSVAVAMFVDPRLGMLKGILIVSLIAELATAVWLLTKGLRGEQATAGA